MRRSSQSETAKRCPIVASLVLLCLAGCGGTPVSSEDSGAGSAGPSSDVTARLEQPVDGSDAAASEQGLPTDFYSVDHYDIEADPAKQLLTTLELAKQGKKTVLLQVGGNWCHWCKKMSQFMASHPEANQLLNENYVVQKVTFDQKNENKAFLSQYPKISGYPHLFVLDATGKLLHSQDTAELESKGDATGKEEGKPKPPYDAERFLALLKEWSPK